jgi:alkanesulfonate monooxygenase SsuD/methylene tetrahydromethanopterin reductase-like flavin-dependent oxidoreductase (luciferase family)
MQVGIGLPNAVPGATGEQLTEFARRADDAGFSTLGTIDRIAYPNVEPLVALAAAAAVTDRIRLATSILIAPYRVNATLIAKQAASIHRLSGGRMVLGTAVGGRQDDYDVSGLDFEERGGESFERMLHEIRHTWANSGESSGAGDDRGVGPDVSEGPPELIVGGSIDAAFRRAAEFGDGWIAGGAPPDVLAQGREKLLAAWNDAGREGEPKVMGLAYFALGEDGEREAREYLGDYYAWLGEHAEGVVQSAAKDADTVRQYNQAFTEAGCDELIWFPSSSDPGQVDLLAGAALGAGVGGTGT